MTLKNFEKPLTKNEIKSKKRGSRKRVLNDSQVSEIRKKYRQWVIDGDNQTMSDLAKEFKTSRQTIHSAIHGVGAYEGI